LHRQGWSVPAMAHEVGISTRTVQRYLKCSTFPERQGRSDRGRSLLNPYKDYVLYRWNEGEHEIKPLVSEDPAVGLWWQLYDGGALHSADLSSPRTVE